MRHIGLIIFLILCFRSVSYSQNQCNCDIYKSQFSELETLLEKKNYEDFDVKIKSLKTENLACKQRIYGFLVDEYVSKNQPEKADSVLTLFSETIKKTTCQEIVAVFNYEKGYLELKRNSFDNATSFLIKAKEVASKLGDTLLQAKAISRLAFSFNKLRQPEKAVEYDYLGIKLLANYKNETQLLQFYSNINGHFGVWFDITADKKYLDSIKKYIPISISLARKLNADSRISQAFSILAGVLWIEKDYRKSLTLCDSSLSYLDPTKHFKHCAAIYQKYCDNYIELKKYDLALQYANLYLQMNKKENDILLIATAYERLYEVNKMMGKTDVALSFYERTVKIRDSIRTNEVTQTVNDIEQKYHKSENEKEINKLNYEKEALSQQKEIDKLQIRSLIGIVAAIILLLVVIVFFYRQTIIKNQLKTIEIEQRLNRARMNPHFFFNALASLQNLSLSDAKKDLVPGFISKFSKIMRQSLESTFNELDTIENEISFLTDYLELQKLRSENRFNYEFELDDSIETNELLLPGMILQPFIENSIEHGFKNISHEGIITIRFTIKDKSLQIIILDNGQGIKDNEKHKTYPSRATQIIKDRLFLLNKTYKSNANFALTTLENDKGIQVEINLPVIYKT